VISTIGAGRATVRMAERGRGSMPVHVVTVASTSSAQLDELCGCDAQSGASRRRGSSFGDRFSAGPSSMGERELLQKDHADAGVGARAAGRDSKSVDVRRRSVRRRRSGV